MKFLTSAALLLLSIPVWAQQNHYRIHNSSLETICPVRKTWTPVDRHVSDFVEGRNGCAYRAHGSLYFFDRKTGKTSRIEKRVSSYDVADNNLLVFVHDRDLYMTPHPGAKRPLRLKGNISSFKLSKSGTLGFVDDGDLYSLTNCQTGAIQRLKGNISSYKIHDNGAFAFVDEGELFLVGDHGKIKKLTDRVYGYEFDPRGSLIFKSRKGVFKVSDCKTGHAERHYENTNHKEHDHGHADHNHKGHNHDSHKSHEHEARSHKGHNHDSHKSHEHEARSHKGHNHDSHRQKIDIRINNGKSFSHYNNELYVQDSRGRQCIARNVLEYSFSGKNVIYKTDRESRIILAENNWRDVKLGSRESTCRILGNGDIEVRDGKSKFCLGKSADYRRIPVDNYKSFRDGIVYAHNKELIYESRRGRTVIERGVDRFYQSQEKLYYCKGKSVFSFNGYSKKCELENVREVHSLSDNRILVSHGREWHILHSKGIKCLNTKGQITVIGKEVLLVEDRTLFSLRGCELERLDWGVDRLLPAGDLLFYFKGKSMYQISDLKNCRTHWVGNIY